MSFNRDLVYETMPFQGYMEGSGLEESDSIEEMEGGMYRTKLAKDVAKAKVAFVKSLMKKGYTERGAKMLFGKEEKKKKVIKSTRGYVGKAEKKPTKKVAKKPTKKAISEKAPLVNRYTKFAVADLKQLAKEKGITIPKGARKNKIINLIVFGHKNVGAPTKKHRKPSAYNLFVGKEMRKGKTLADAIQAWRERK